MGGFDARSWDGMVLKGGESEELEIGGEGGWWSKWLTGTFHYLLH